MVSVGRVLVVEADWVLHARFAEAERSRFAGRHYRAPSTGSGGQYQHVPWSRVDWTNHGRRDHLVPHQHPLHLQSDGSWRWGPRIGFPTQ